MWSLGLLIHHPLICLAWGLLTFCRRPKGPLEALIDFDFQVMSRVFAVTFTMFVWKVEGVLLKNVMASIRC